MFPSWSKRAKESAAVFVSVMLVTAALVIALSSLISVNSASAGTFPGANGKIAFVSTRDGNNAEIYLMNADGSGQTRLTVDPAATPAVDAEPSWSADGSKIAFRSNRDGSFFGEEIYKMNADGTAVTRVTNEGASVREPSWSPDGLKIAFTIGGNDIYVVNADGTGLTQLTFDAAQDTKPSWSPDGLRIAFMSGRGGNVDIYVMNAVTGESVTPATRLTTNAANDVAPSWSPDGSKIAFHSNRNFVPPDIYVMNAVTGESVTPATRLTNNAVQDVEASWSPDGSKIAFQSLRDGNFEIYVMNADGTNPTNLSNNPASETDPDWGTHGTAPPNQAPTANAGPDQTVNEGTTVAFDGSGSSDPDGTIVSYEWDLDNDGMFDDATGVTVSRFFADNGIFTIGLKVTDNSGETDTDTAQVTVNNVNPAVNAGADAAINEADTFTGSGSFADPGADTWTATVDYGDGSGVQPLTLNPDKTFSLSHTYSDDDADDLYTVIVTVTDDDAGVGTDTVLVRVSNVNPSVNAGPDSAPIDEGGTFASSGSFTDPGADSWSATVDYGDGTGAQALSLNPDKTFSLGHTYPDDDADDAFTVTVQVADDDGGSGSDTAIVTVNNLAPVVGSITAPIDPKQVNTAVSASASFTDAGTLDTHTATWDWGDGSTSPGTVIESGGSGTVTGSHTYITPGVYTLQLTVTDDDGDSGSQTFQYIVIYDPTAGFVTGGGWIDSPAGAYTADNSLTGKANFGFTSKYEKGATIPTGKTSFKFHVADLDFNSNSYEWLVVAGAKAQYKGTGTVNDAGNYGFMLTAIDGQITGGGGIDKFRIKIWDKATDTVVYDNQLGALDDANPTTVIGGGNIKIHKA